MKQTLMKLEREMTAIIKHEARTTNDPIAMADLTVKAVDQIGEAAANEIEQAAAAIEQHGHDVANKLRELAAAIRSHTTTAGEHVDAFCKKATDVVMTIRELEVRTTEATTNGTGRG